MQPVLSLARLSVTDPRAAARHLRAAAIPRDAHWTLFLLVCVLGGISAQTTLVLAPLPEGAPGGSGLMFVALTGAAVFLTMGIMILAGRVHGARAEATEVLLLATWWQGLAIVAQFAGQLVSLAAMATAPSLAGVLTIGVIVLVIWMLAGFTAELFGLTLGQAGLGLIAAVIGMAILLAFVLNVIGVVA